MNAQKVCVFVGVFVVGTRVAVAKRVLHCSCAIYSLMYNAVVLKSFDGTVQGYAVGVFDRVVQIALGNRFSGRI